MPNFGWYPCPTCNGRVEAGSDSGARDGCLTCYPTPGEPEPAPPEPQPEPVPAVTVPTDGDIICEVCGRADFASVAGLANHTRSAHPETEEAPVA